MTGVWALCNDHRIQLRTTCTSHVEFVELQLELTAWQVAIVGTIADHSFSVADDIILPPAALSMTDTLHDMTGVWAHCSDQAQDTTLVHDHWY